MKKKAVWIIVMSSLLSVQVGLSCWELLFGCCCSQRKKKEPSYRIVPRSDPVSVPTTLINQKFTGVAGVRKFKELFPELARSLATQEAEIDRQARCHINSHDDPYRLRNENLLQEIRLGRLSIDSNGTLYGRR